MYNSTATVTANVTETSLFGILQRCVAILFNATGHHLLIAIHRQRLGLVPVCGHTVIADFLASSDGGHTGTEVF